MYSSSWQPLIEILGGSTSTQHWHRY